MTNTVVDLAKIRRRVQIIQARRKIERRDMEELAQHVLQLAMFYQASQDALTDCLRENTAKGELLDTIRRDRSSYSWKGPIDALFLKLTQANG